MQILKGLRAASWQSKKRQRSAGHGGIEPHCYPKSIVRERYNFVKHKGVYSKRILAIFSKYSAFGRRLTAYISNLTLATVNGGVAVLVRCQVIQGVTVLLDEACLEKGLIVVPGFPDAEPLRPSASGFSEGGQIPPTGGKENLFGEGFRLARIAVPRDHALRRQLREAGKARRNDGQARSHGLHQGNGQAFIDGGKYEEIESGEKTGYIQTAAVEEHALRNTK